jgi:hypothetical protein
MTSISSQLLRELLGSRGSGEKITDLRNSANAGATWGEAFDTHPDQAL